MSAPHYPQQNISHYLSSSWDALACPWSWPDPAPLPYPLPHPFHATQGQQGPTPVMGPACDVGGVM